MSERKFIEQQKQLYRSLEPCYCPAIQEVVYFNAEGLRHLLYDNKHRPRNMKEKVYKTALIDYVVTATVAAKKAKQKTFSNPLSQLWILSWVRVKDIRETGYLTVKVVLRKKGRNGSVHFLSVMRKKTNRKLKTKKPKP